VTAHESAPVATPPVTGLRTVALLGNPNTGKTTIFNALTGFRGRVANYPGVTVEKKTGPLTGVEGVSVLDLPGTYSLAARSPDEMVAVDVLLGRRPDTPRPDAVVVVVDASNLERNLYLASQVFEAGLPVVLALNMTDVARARGHEIDVAALSAGLGVPVVPLAANRGEGVPALVAAIGAALREGLPPRPLAAFPSAFEAEVAALVPVLRGLGTGDVPEVERRRILLDVGGAAEARAVAALGPPVAAAVAAARARLAAAGVAVEGLEATLRYGAIGALTERAVRRPEVAPVTLTDRIDAVLTHRVVGSIAFLALMTLVFLSIFSWAEPLMGFLEKEVFGRLQAFIEDGHKLGGGAFENLVVTGILGGVGGVLVFLPQIVILFGFLAILEDSGYMARAAFLMDRLLRWCGLSGRSFIPMLSSFACAVPGIMAARTIESRRDRIATILTAPLMSCSARIPVYLLIVGAFVPPGRLLGIDQRALLFAGMYLLGIVLVVPVAWILKRTLLRGESPPFLMELPPYQMPKVRAVAQRMRSAGTAFVVRAGTLILATSVIVWALSWFPRDAEVGRARDAVVAEAGASLERALAAAPTDEARDAARTAAAAAVEEAEAHAAGEFMRRSALGRMGRAVEPVFEPIGWDWKVAVAVIASFPAREVVVGTLGVLYDVSGDPEESTTLRDRLKAARWEDGPRRGQPVFDLGSALALMVFFALCLQCVSTLAVMRKETGTWGWPVFAFVYMTTLAYLGAWLTAVVTRALS